MTRAAQTEASVSVHLAAGSAEIVELEGEFDASNAAEIERELAAASGPEPANVVVDLRGVRFLDSTAMVALVRGSKRATERGKGFALIRPNPLVWRVFVLSGLSDRFVTCSSLHEALSLQ